MRCLSLCLWMMALFCTSVFGENQQPQKAVEKNCTTCQDKKTSAPEKEKGYPCICPLYEYGGVWYAEEHAENTHCQLPVYRILTGTQFVGNCVTEGCTGDGCFSIAPAPCIPPNAKQPVTPVPEPEPILEEPLPMKENPPPAKYINFMDPRFIKLKLPHKKKPIFAKVYTAVINVREIAEDANQTPPTDANPKPPAKKKIKLNPMRGEFHIHMIGFQTDRIPKNMKVETFKPIKDRCGNPSVNCREALVDFGLHNGYVLLAPEAAPAPSP